MDGPDASQLQGISERVTWFRRREHPIEHKALVGDSKGVEFLPGAFRFPERRSLGATDQNKGGARRIGQRIQSPLIDGALLIQAGQRPETGGAGGIGLEVSRPGLGQRQQAERVTGRGRVKDHMVEISGCDGIPEESGKLVEGRDLHRAGTGKLLFHADDGRLRQHAPVRPN